MGRLRSQLIIRSSAGTWLQLALVAHAHGHADADTTDASSSWRPTITGAPFQMITEKMLMLPFTLP